MYNKKDEILQEIDILANEQKADEIKTVISKNKFISEIKNGLGDDIKENPSGVEIIIEPKKTFKQKLIEFFKLF